MSLVSSRVYKDEKDFRTIIDLIASIRPPANLNDYPIKVDIEENLTSPPTHTNTRLWFDNKRPIAWAYVDDFNNLCWASIKDMKSY